RAVHRAAVTRALGDDVLEQSVVPLIQRREHLAAGESGLIAARVAELSRAVERALAVAGGGSGAHGLDIREQEALDRVPGRAAVLLRRDVVLRSVAILPAGHSRVDGVAVRGARVM